MNTRNYLWLPYLFIAALWGGCNRDTVEVRETPPDGYAQAQLSAMTASIGITSKIRILGFDYNNRFSHEVPSILLADTAIKQTMMLPIGPCNIVLLGNAGEKGDVAPITSMLSPSVTQLNDVMFQLTDNGSGLPQPPQYFYGRGNLTLAVGPDQEIKIPMKNLCSRADIHFINVPAHVVDSVQVYIDRSGKEVRFDGSVTAVGTTQKYSFHPQLPIQIKTDTFLLFPSQSGIKPIMNARFFLASGHERVFQKTLNYEFTSNRVLKFTFDLKDVTDSVNMILQLADWKGTVIDSVQSTLSLNLSIDLNNARASNYSRADITLLHQSPDHAVYPIKYTNLPLTAHGGQLQTNIPLSHIQPGNYQLTNVQLHDADGSFEALKTVVNTNIGLGNTVLNAEVIGRTLYEGEILRQWLLEMDANNGTDYPGLTYWLALSTPFFDLMNSNLFSTLGFSNTIIRNEKRAAGVNILAVTLRNLKVPSYMKKLNYFTSFTLAPCLIDTLNLRNLPNLNTLNIAGCRLSSLDLSGCRQLVNVTQNLQPTDIQAFRKLKISSTGVKTLSPNLINLQTLYWADCGITTANAAVLSNYTNLREIDISFNQLTDYPNLKTIANSSQLTYYKVSWNNIVSCALPYMERFGIDNILPQRTGSNWWCP